MFTRLLLGSLWLRNYSFPRQGSSEQPIETSHLAFQHLLPRFLHQRAHQATVVHNGCHRRHLRITLPRGPVLPFSGFKVDFGDQPLTMTTPPRTPAPGFCKQI
jgi:hypothetical protein